MVVLIYAENPPGRTHDNRKYLNSGQKAIWLKILQDIETEKDRTSQSRILL